ncbi:MAG: 4Fe-4S dicluster domain-containing protein [Acidobacteriia bacterium]|nr:4Fe-4S dicluster domain-containing protein [Terriglobia bacterium]
MSGTIVHSVEFDRALCVACVACCKACPTQAIRVREGRVVVDGERCIDCGECIRACPHDAVSARTSSPSDLKRFRYTVAIPSTTLFSQFGGDVEPARIAEALLTLGFDRVHDMSWMCEMVGRAVDTYLSECGEPWPKISVTCPGVIRLIQLRYPDLVPHLLPFESPRELTAKLVRRKLSVEQGIPASDIGAFYITPCSAIMHSILWPVGLEESYLDGAFSVAEIYGPLRRAIEEAAEVPAGSDFSPRGLNWAVAGGETAMMRSGNTLTLSGVQDVTYVFDRIESGKFRSVDFIEAYICPDGCVSGPLLIEGRYAAKRALREVVSRLGARGAVQEEKVRSLVRDHFFDLEEEVRARPVKAPSRDLREAVRLKQEKDHLLSSFPRKDCAACGAPTCEALAEDVLRGAAATDDCVFVKLDRLAPPPVAPGAEATSPSGAERGSGRSGPPLPGEGT